MEKLFSKGAIVRRDIERVYEGLYLDTITSLENLIERLFLGLLTRRLFHNSYPHWLPVKLCLVVGTMLTGFHIITLNSEQRLSSVMAPPFRILRIQTRDYLRTSFISEMQLRTKVAIQKVNSNKR
jgi:hypothetical protein